MEPRCLCGHETRGWERRGDVLLRHVEGSKHLRRSYPTGWGVERGIVDYHLDTGGAAQTVTLVDLETGIAYTQTLEVIARLGKVLKHKLQPDLYVLGLRHWVQRATSEYQLRLPETGIRVE